MSLYKVGDVAALFSKPKEANTESGKRLQSLFKEFHSKNKNNPQPYQNKKKMENNLVQGSGKTESQGVPKYEKKRKFSAASPESNVEVSNSKKSKKFKNQEETKPTMHNEKQHFLAEQDFPRKKKLPKTELSNFNNDNFNASDSDETAFADIKQVSKHEKKVSSFIRKSKQQRIASMSDNVKRENNEKMSNVDAVTNGTLFKDDSEKFTKKNKKKQFHEDNLTQNTVTNDTLFADKNEKFTKKKEKKNKKKRFHEDNLTQNTVTNGTLFKDESEKFTKNKEKKNKKKRFRENNLTQNTESNETGQNDLDKSQEMDQTSDEDISLAREVKDFIRSAKKKNFGGNFKNSQPKAPVKEEPDFIKIPGLNPNNDEDKLCRTLFVANLPVNTRRKDLKTLFSPFGVLEQIRCHGIETDKAKIFNEDGSKTRNANNFAAESIPGFIVYEERQSAVNALSLSGSLFKGHHISVDFALPPGSNKLYDDKRSIFIGNLPFGCTDESVWEAFSDCGRIECVRIVRDKNTGIGKGFGYVQFSTVLSKENALALEDVMIQGRSIRIKNVDSHHDKTIKKKTDKPLPVKRDTFKSRAIRIKMKCKESGSRKSVRKIMKKQKKLHNKKKVATILQKSMKL